MKRTILEPRFAEFTKKNKNLILIHKGLEVKYRKEKANSQIKNKYENICN